MISSFFGLQTALRGVLAQQRELDVTSHNIANANTDGYSRQQAVLTATDALHLPIGALFNGAPASLGSGVDVAAYQRIRDSFLDLQYRAQNQRLGDADTTSRSLDQVELAFAEPGDNGLSAQLAKFWSAWSDVSNAPESVAARQVVVDQAKTIATSFSELDTQLAQVQQQAADEYASITGSGGQVEGLAKDIANLSAAIQRAVSSGDTPNDLLDKRDADLDKLSQLGQVSVTDLGDGTIQVAFGDAGTPLVDGTTVNWPQTLTAPGGKLGALLQLSNPGGTVDTYRTDLANVAQQLAGAVNALHNPGGTGTDFFTWTGTNLTVNVTAATVRTSTSGAPGANDIALAIAGLRGGSVDNAYTDLVTRIGSDLNEANRERDNSQTLVNSVEDRRQSTSGVSLDEEMTNLVRFQRGYQASARALTAMDSMLDTLINRTGTVGL